MSLHMSGHAQCISMLLCTDCCLLHCACFVFLFWLTCPVHVITQPFFLFSSLIIAFSDSNTANQQLVCVNTLSSFFAPWLRWEKHCCPCMCPNIIGRQRWFSKTKTRCTGCFILKIVPGGTCLYYITFTFYCVQLYHEFSMTFCTPELSCVPFRSTQAWCIVIPQLMSIL